MKDVRKELIARLITNIAEYKIGNTNTTNTILALANTGLDIGALTKAKHAKIMRGIGM